MAFQKSNVNFQFQQPNIQGLVRQAPDISGGLETLFNQYMQMKQGQRADQASGLQAQAAQQQIALGQDQAALAPLMRAAQFDGVDPLSQGPEGLRQSMGPKTMVESPEISGIRSAVEQFMSRKKSATSMAAQEQSLGLDETRSVIAKNEASAKALGEQQVYVDPDTGKQIIVPRGAKLIPRPPKGGRVATNQDLNSAMELYETAKEGLISGLGGSETGQFVGRLPAITAKQQIAKGSVAAMAPVLKQIFRTAGEGVFTDRDQQLLLDMIPTRTELPEARAAMIANIDAIVKAKIKSGMRNAVPNAEFPSESAPINLTGEKAARLAELRAKRGR